MSEAAKTAKITRRLNKVLADIAGLRCALEAGEFLEAATEARLAQRQLERARMFIVPASFVRMKSTGFLHD